MGVICNPFPLSRSSRTDALAAGNLRLIYSNNLYDIHRLVRGPIFVLFLFARACAADNPAPPASGEPWLAQSRALIGHNYLGLGRLEEAKTNCDATLRVDAANELAKDCLRWVASMLIDQDLNNAYAKFLQGDNRGAIELAAKWTNNAMPRQEKRARYIIGQARSNRVYVWWTTFTPDWLRQTLIAIGAILALTLLLIGFRKLWREWRRAEWYGPLASATRWSMLPLKELTNPPAGIATDHFLDALVHLPGLLRVPLWKPRLLLLRPTPPADHEPAIIDAFVSSLDPPPITLFPQPSDLGLTWQEHDVQLDEAFQNLQLRAASGLDLGTVARLITGVVHWFNAGSPTISGIQTEADGNTSIHVVAAGGKVKCVSVTASARNAPGFDATQFTAYRVAFKLLLRMKYTEMTNNEIEGFAALRQAVSLFGQYAGTARGVGDGAQARNSSLKQSAGDFGLFRSSIPTHATASNADPAHSPGIITDEIRQSALLAEGVAHALVGDDEGLNAAIVCFRELQDWPGFSESSPLRRQAAYNEAVVWRLKGSSPQAAVLMLTELIGDYSPDTERPSPAALRSPPDSTKADKDPILFAARLARLSAFAQYAPEDWTTITQARIDVLINDAKRLVEDIQRLSDVLKLSEHEQRVREYIKQQALRAIGHVEVLRLVRGPAGAHLYDQDHRPMKDQRPSSDDRQRLEDAIEWMNEAAGVPPTQTLYCDLAYAYLLLKQFEIASGYARHATLQNDSTERAFYLAFESYLLEGTEYSRTFAKKYAAQFKTPKSPEFLALREELQIS